MTTDETVALENRLEIPTYSKMPMALERGEGSHVWDAAGTRYLDFYGGHCVALLGHCPPRVVEAIEEQARTLLFYSNVAHSPVRARAAERLVAMAPDGLDHVFFANSGSEANETALKLARTTTGKDGLLALEHGFHGRTLGSLAATYADKYRRPYSGVLPDATFVPVGDVDAVEEALATGTIGGVILEPIQSIAGMRMVPTPFVEALRALCDRYGAKLIFDEVQTGVGRTGTFSMAGHYGVRPDMITLAKSLGGGVPVSAVLVDDAVAATVEPGDQGSTFGGGMLAMAAVEAVLETIEADDLMARAGAIHRQVRAAAAPHAAEVRGKGCLIGLRFERPVAPIVGALREHGVLVGGSADPEVMRLMPPLTATDADVAEFADALAAACAAPVSG